MITHYPPLQPLSQKDQIITQNQYIQQLTKLNESLKAELYQCHRYIQNFEKDLNQTPPKHNLSVNSLDRGVTKDQTLEREELIWRVNKLEQKLNEKRWEIRRMQKQKQELQQHLFETTKQRDEILMSLNNMQYLLDNKATTDKEALIKLQNSLAEQRQTIQLYCKELNSKSGVIEKTYKKLEDMERQRGVIINENEGLRQMNFSLAQKMHECEKKAQQKEAKLEIEIKQIQKKYVNEIAELKKINKMLKEEANYQKSNIINNLSNRSISKIESVTRIMPASESISKRQSSVDKNQQSQKLRSIQQEIISQKQKSERLKNDLMTMKLQNSSLMVKNNELSQQVIKLQRSRNQLLAKADDFNNVRTMKSIERDESKHFNYIRNSSTKNIVSIQTSISKRVSKTPQDQEIPVHDKCSLRKKPNQDQIETRKVQKVSNISAAFLPLR